MKSGAERPVVVIAGVIASIVAIVALTLAPVKGWENLKKVVLGLWLVGPPIWFWVEYTFLTPEEVKNDSSRFERLRYAQGLAAKVWVAVAALLGLLYFKLTA